MDQNITNNSPPNILLNHFLFLVIFKNVVDADANC